MKRVHILNPVFLLLIINLTPIRAQDKILTLNQGHSHRIHCAQYSPDGKYLATGGLDRTIRIWDMESGKLLRILSGHIMTVTDLEFTSDGKTLVSGCADRMIKIWDVSSGRELNSIPLFDLYKPIDYFTFQVSLSVDDKYVICPTGENTCNVYDISTGEEIKKIGGDETRITDAVFGPDGKYILTASKYDKDGVKLWDMNTGKLVRTFKTKEMINCIAFNSDASMFAAGSKKKLLVWDINKEKPVKSLSACILAKKDFNRITPKIQFLKESEILITEYNEVSVLKYVSNIYRASKELSSNNPDLQKTNNLLDELDDNRIIRIIDYQTGKTNQSYYGGTFTISPDQQNVVLAVENFLRHVDIKTSTASDIFFDSKNLAPQTDIAISPNYNYLASLSFDNSVSILNLNTSYNKRLITDQKGIEKIDFLPEINSLVTQSNKEIKHFDVITGYETSSFNAPEKYEFTDITPEAGIMGRTKLSDSLLILKKWDNINFDEIDSLNTEIIPVNSFYNKTVVDFSVDGKYAATGRFREIQLWDLNTKSNVGNLEIPQFKTPAGNLDAYHTKIVFSPDNKYILIIPRTLYFCLYNLDSKKFSEPLDGHMGLSLGGDFSSDNGLVLTYSESGNAIKLWDVNSANEIHEFKIPSAAIYSAKFSSDDNFIISSLSDGLTQIWDTQTGDLVLSICPFSHSEDYVAFTPDGKFDGTEDSFEALYFVKGMEIIPLEEHFNESYTPKLVPKVLHSTAFK